MYLYLGECGKPCTPWLPIVILWWINSICRIKSCICILRVEVPDGTYTLVPADEDEGAGGDVHYVTVEQDPDQSPEGCLSACADEGKPRFIH
jgi:hypothetical protein